MRPVARQLWWLVECLTLTAACLGGQSGTPTGLLDPGPDPRLCDDSPDARTALGVTGHDLWKVVSGEYRVEVERSQDAFGKQTVGPSETITIAIERSTEPMEGTKACDVVTVAVRVDIESMDPNLAGSYLGTASGTPLDAVIAFSTEADEGDSRLGGSLVFDPTLKHVEISTHARKSDTRWRFERDRIQP